MSTEGPEEYELNILENLLKSIEKPPEDINTGKWCAIFGVIGAILLVCVYFLHKEDWLGFYWRYFLCVLSGVCISSAALINRDNIDSKYVVKYLDKEAINKRIAELNR